MWGAWTIVLALLVAVAVLTAEGEPDPGGAAGAAAQPASIEEIARRVERIRGVRFDELPEPKRVTPERARTEGLDAFDRDYPQRRRRADEAMYRMLGVVPEDLDLRELVGSVFDDQVAGYYDPETKRLRVVEGPGMDNATYAEIILAHELTHALEDQAFDLDLDDLQGSDDAALAYSALVEGTATALMFDYATTHFTGEQLLSGVLASAFSPPPDLPPFLQAQLLFPYETGLEFAMEVHAAAGDRWTLLDAALRHRPPASTEQVIHPEKFLAFERPERVRVRAEDIVGEGRRRMRAGTFGEWQTRELLRQAGVAGADAAAEGWGGDRYELWGGSAGEALVVRWRWDSAADRREALAALRAYAASDTPRGATAVAARDASVTLAIAPEPALAARLARAPG